MKTHALRLLTMLAVLTATLFASVNAAPLPANAEVLKIGYTDGLSGFGAQTGDGNLKHIQAGLDWVNDHGGVLGKRLELVAIDNKGQPADAVVALQVMLDQNLPVVLNCGASNVSAALISAVDKNNERNPDHRIVYVNCGGVAPELTNEKCSFWHFRVDANATMKSEIMVRALPKNITKVYMINQDYLFGQAVQRDLRAYLTKLRPDVQIVGDELVPLGKVLDFSPYISKIRSSGAQAVLTGNWGKDMQLLIKASNDSGLDAQYYTFYAHLAGSPTAIGTAGDGRIHSVMAFSENVPVETGNKELEAWVQKFHDSHDFDFGAANLPLSVMFIQAAINKAGRADALSIANAMDGMTIKDLAGHDATMRSEDHQVLMAYYVGTFTKGTKFQSEKTGLGWKIDATILGPDTAQPTTCKMKRPVA
jgi:branched-chain amino acid transport system substrate-binding protein